MHQEQANGLEKDLFGVSKKYWSHLRILLQLLGVVAAAVKVGTPVAKMLIVEGPGAVVDNALGQEMATGPHRDRQQVENDSMK